MPDIYVIVPPSPDELSIGTAAKPVKDVVLSGSVTDASANASTAVQIKSAVTHAAGTGSPHTASGVGADAAGTAASAVSVHAAITASVHNFDGSGKAPPQAHAASHAIGVADTVYPTGAALQVLRRNAANNALEFATPAVGTGDVVGPASAVDSNFAAFNTTTGKLIKDSGANVASFDTAGAAAVVAGNLSTHAGLSTTAHGGIVASSDPRLTDARTPTAHALTNALHAETGLTTGHFLKATGATTFAFGAHGLTYSDVGAAATSHAHAGTDITSGTIDGDRLPAMSTAKKGGVPATGTPTGLYLKDDGTWGTPAGTGVTSVTATAPITSSGGTTPDVKIGTAIAPTTADALADVIWGTSATTKKALVLQAYSATQTGNMLELQTSAGAARALFNASGALGIGTTVPTSGKLALKSAADLPALGSELTAFAGWTSTNWTGDYTVGYTHTVGFTDALTRAGTAAVIGTIYHITWTVTGRTAGSFSVGFGGLTYSGVTTSYGYGPKATSTAAITFTPTSDFDGTISAISVKAITGASPATITMYNTSNDIASESRATFRQVPANYPNIYSGLNCGGYSTVGMGNSGFGGNSLRLVTSGNLNAGFGWSALQNVVTGGNNTGIGSNALGALVSGTSSTAVGYNCLSVCTAGEMTGLGASAGQAQVASGSGVFLGAAAGMYSTGSNNTIAGHYSYLYPTTGQDNCIYGKSAAQSTVGVTASSFNCIYGSQAGYGLANSCQYNSIFGYKAGYTLAASQAGCVFLGSQAGYYETVSNKLLIDNAARASEADARVKALIYGVFNAAVANQHVQINGRLGVQANNTFGTVNKLTVCTSTTTDNSASSQLNACADTSKALVLQGYSATQSANLAEYQSSAGAVQAAVDKNGQRIFNVISAAGATPVDSDVSAWANDTAGVVKGTGGRIFFAFKNAADVYYVEATAI